MRVSERVIQPVDAVRVFVMMMFGDCLLVNGETIAFRPSRRTSHQFQGGR